MHEFDKAPKPVPFDTFLQIAGDHDLTTLGLPDINRSLDTTSFTAESQTFPKPPENGPYAPIHDVREVLSASREEVQKGIWGFGDLVRGTFSLHLRQNSQTGGLRVLANAVTEVQGTSRSSENLVTFDLSEHHTFTPQEIDTISNLGLVKFNANVRVWQHANSRYYNGILETVTAVQTPFDGSVEQLCEGDMVVVEGVVAEYRPGQRKNWHLSPDEDETSPRLVVTTPAGAPIQVHLGSFSELDYGSSAQQASGGNTVTPPQPIVGDTVRVAATYRSLLPGVQDPTLAVNDRSSIHLLEKSDARIDAALQTEIALQMFEQELSAAPDIAQARQAYGKIIAEHLFEENGLIKLQLGDHDYSRVRRLVEQRFQHVDESLRPAGIRLGNYNGPQLQHAFQTDVHGISWSEFTELAYKVAGGTHAVHPSTPVATIATLFELFADEPHATTNLIVQALTSRYQQTGSIEAYGRPATQLDAQWVLEGLDRSLSVYDKRAVLPAVLAIGADLFASSQPEGAFKQFLRVPVLGNIRSALVRCGEWGEMTPLLYATYNHEYDADKLRYISDRQAFDVLRQALPALLPAMRAADEQTMPKHDGGRQFTDIIDDIEALLAQLNAKLPPEA